MMKGNFIQWNKNKLPYNQHEMLKRKSCGSKEAMQIDKETKWTSTDAATLQWGNC
jgi:hypothetical protein